MENVGRLVSCRCRGRADGRNAGSCHRLRFAIDPAKQSPGDGNSSEMWFLLTRHVVSKDHPSEFISLDAVSRGLQIDQLAEDLLSRQVSSLSRPDSVKRPC